MSLRTRLVALAILAMTLLIGERVIGIISLHATTLEIKEREVLDLTEQGAGHFEKVLTGVRSILLTLAAEGPLLNDPAKCGTLRQVVEASSLVESLSVLDRDGIITCSSAPAGIGLDLSAREYFLLGIKGLPALTTVARSYATAAPTIFASQPVVGEGGAVTAILLARVSLNDMFPRSAIGRLNPSAEIIMVDAEGVVIQAQPDMPNLIGKNLRSTEFVARALSRSRGTIIADGVDGVSRIYGFVRLPSSNMHLLVGLDRAAMTAQVESATWRAATTLLAASFIIFLGLWIAGERLIVAPVLTLAARLARFGRGEDDQREQDGPLITELQPLVVAFEAMADELTRRESALRSANRRLNSLASLDPLTGIANRRSFDSVLALQWSTVPNLAMLMIDIDRFKLFNDRYGHGKGDDCIRRVAQAMMATVRGTDVIARIGGEEFAVIMPGADIGPAQEVAQRLRQAVEQLAIPHSGSQDGVVTISVGCAAGRPGPDFSSSDLQQAADKALYAAKEAGRNTVRSAPPFEVRTSNLS
ncbi:diguanylate cyclase [Ancylobacter sp. G4_0304]|uniref:sensor domain-containing diguanylate cyclase n=1 Tax=Ancylobacter sp. G4_0304 TaxID=3114289 RepID=UPI0039C6F06C